MLVRVVHGKGRGIDGLSCVGFYYVQPLTCNEMIERSSRATSCMCEKWSDLITHIHTHTVRKASGRPAHIFVFFRSSLGMGSLGRISTMGVHFFGLAQGGRQDLIICCCLKRVGLGLPAHDVCDDYVLRRTFFHSVACFFSCGLTCETCFSASRSRSWVARTPRADFESTWGVSMLSSPFVINVPCFVMNFCDQFRRFLMCVLCWVRLLNLANQFHLSMHFFYLFSLHALLRVYFLSIVKAHARLL